MLKFYQLYQKYGMLAFVGLATVFIGVSLLVLNATTFVIHEDGTQEEIETYRERKETERQERYEARDAAEEERRKEFEANGVKFTKLTKEQIAANERYDEEKMRRERDEEEFELLNMPKVGELSVLMGNMWFFIYLAVIICIAAPLYLAGRSIYYKEYFTVAKIGGTGLALFVLYLIGRAASSVNPDILEKVSESSQLRAGGLLVSTIVLLVVVVVGIIGSEIYSLVKRL